MSARRRVCAAVAALAAAIALPAPSFGAAPAVELVACLATDPDCSDPRPLDGAVLVEREFGIRLLGQRRAPVDFAVGDVRRTENFWPFDAYGSGEPDGMNVVSSLTRVHAPGVYEATATSDSASYTATFTVADRADDRLVACLDRACTDTVPLDGAVLGRPTFGIRWLGEAETPVVFEIDARDPQTERFFPFDGYGTDDADGTTRFVAHADGRHTARVTLEGATVGASFHVTLPGSAVSRLALRDPASEHAVGGHAVLGNGETLFVDELPGRPDPARLEIEAVTTRPEIGYVEFRLDGRLVAIDRAPPYTLPLEALGRGGWRTVEATPYGSSPGLAGTPERISLWVRGKRPESCTDASLQRLIDEARGGGGGGLVTVTVPPCLYRESLHLWSGDIALVADPDDPGAEIRGSDVWPASAFVEDAAAGGWLSDAAHTVPELPTKTFDPELRVCADDTFDCLPPEQVFVDGRALERANGATDEGDFWIRLAPDDSRRVVLRDDPAGALIEVTTRSYWIDVRDAKATVQGFRMRHAGHGVGTGRAGLRGGRSSGGSAFRDNVLSEANVPISPGSSSIVSGNDVFLGGQQAISTQGDDLLIEGNRFRHSNTGGFYRYWEAGGMKFVKTDRMTFRKNEVAFNAGYGLWYDIDNYSATVTDNRLHHNELAGVHYEISGSLDRPSDVLPERADIADTVIVGNAVWENGWPNATWSSGGSGIFIASSRNVEVRDNTVAWNADGVSVVAQQTGPEGARRCRYDDVRNVSIHGNRIVHTPFNFTRFEADGTATFDERFDDVLATAFRNEGGCQSGMYVREDVRAYANTYWFDPRFPADAVRYAWGEEKYVSLDAFGTRSRDGTDADGRSRVELDPTAVLSEANVPRRPEPRP